MAYKNVNQKQSFPELEKEILRFWQKEEIFEQTLGKNPKANKFVFYEGPPTANGRPGIHHVIGRSFKDIILRYKTMRGYYVSRKAGWDTHGLPVEIQVEKELGISGKKEIENFGIENFNKKCKESVFKYKAEWEDLTRRIGFWIDLENPYITYENTYIEQVWSLLKIIYDQKLLYLDFKVVPYCPRCGTPLSSHEVAQGYKTVTDNSVYIKFKLKKEPKTFVISWTTTPWTLPGNVALAVGKDIEYKKIKVGAEIWIIGAARIKDVIKEDFDEIQTLKGSDLVGLEYEPLFNVDELKSEKSYKIYDAPFVTTEDGTGVVHTAVMYGEDDYELGKIVDLPKFHTVDSTGHFIGSIKELGGLHVKDRVAEEKIINHLKAGNNLLKEESHEHEYPFCWRCDSALIYYAKTSWFIAMTKVKEKLIANNETVNWMPEYIKDGRFGEWLREVKDWALSRERYWGTPLPIWECSCGEKIFIGSISELEEKSTKKLSEIDLHRPFVDEILIKCPKCGKEAKRVKDLIDVWFDSGSMPFASGEYPENFPADYIAEAIDQTRGWFYTLLAISTLLEKGSPYKNVLCYSHVLDEHGKKMSKSKGNILDPWTVIDEFGADATRWFFYTVNAPGDPKLMGPRNVQESLRKFNLILWNVYSFFTTYANIDGWKYDGGHWEPQKTLDKWVVNYFNKLVKGVESKLDKFDIVGAAREIEQFNTDLSTWYLRRTRKRRDNDFYATMFKILIHFTKVIAPFTPFLAEEIYQNLKSSGDFPASVHLCDWPDVGEADEKLLQDMNEVRRLAEQGRALRAEASIRNRQPLASFTIDSDLGDELKEILKDELNVNQIIKGEKVTLDTKITPELKQEGIRRDIVRLIQDLRKKANLSPSDQAKLYYQADGELAEAIDKTKTQTEKDTKVILHNEKKDLDISAEAEIDSRKIWLGLE